MGKILTYFTGTALSLAAIFSPAFSQEHAEKMPESVDLSYKISPGYTIKGDTLKGGCRLKKEKGLSSLLVRFEHPREDKFIEVTACDIGNGHYEYREFAYNLLEKRVEFNVVDTLTSWGKPSIPFIINKILSGNAHNLDDVEFVFRGEQKEFRTYKINLDYKAMKKREGDVVGKIEKNSPKVKRVSMTLEEKEGMWIPQNLSLDYSVHYLPVTLFGIGSKTLRFPAEITSDTLFTNRSLFDPRNPHFKQ